MSFDAVHAFAGSYFFSEKPCRSEVDVRGPNFLSPPSSLSDARLSRVARRLARAETNVRSSCLFVTKK